MDIKQEITQCQAASGIYIDADLAKKAGISTSSLSLIKNGKIKPNLVTLSKIFGAMGFKLVAKKVGE